MGSPTDAHRWKLLILDFMGAALFLIAVWQRTPIEPSLDVPPTEFTTMKKRARMHGNNGYYDSSFYYFNQCRKIAEARDDQKLLSKVLLEIANLHYITNNFVESEKHALEALKIAKRGSFRDLEYVGLSVLGMISTDNKNYASGIEYNYKAIDLLKKEKFHADEFYLETSLNNLGVAYQSSGEHQIAEEAFQSALKNSQIEKDPKLQAMLIDNLAYSSLKLGRADSVEKSMSKALAIRQRIHDIPGMIINHIHLAEYHYERQYIEKALKHIVTAYKMASQANLPSEKILSLQHLIKIDPANQAQYIDEYIRISDSVKIVERRNHNKFARIAYETDDILQQKDKAERQKQFLAGSSLAIVSILGLAATVLYQRLKHRKLELDKFRQEANTDMLKMVQSRQSEITMARDAEKKRIARELHDGVMNRLAGTRINLETLRESQDQKTINKCLGHIGQLHEIERELRTVSHDLNRDADPSLLEFNHMLEALVNDGAQTSNIAIQFDSRIKDWRGISNSIKMTLYRIIQEALGNSNKHAHAAHIYIVIFKQQDRVNLVFHDDGKGFSVKSGHQGIGIKNMKARIKNLKGTIEIISGPDMGTSIKASIPIQANWQAES
jgi:signal transduction histidine kinase